MKFLRSMVAGALAAPLLASAGLPAHAAAKTGAASNEAVATVNGVPVPKARVDAILKQQVAHGTPDNDHSRKVLREELINREIVTQEAVKSGLAKLPEIQTQLELARQNVLVNAYLGEYFRKHPITDEEIRQQYERIKAQQGNKEYKARHILVSSEDQAKALIDQLDKGAKFEELAAKNSIDKGTKDLGGDLDWTVPGNLDRQFADAMVKLQKGKYTPTPVHTRFGYHVIQLEDVREVKFPSVDEVKPKIERQVMAQRMEELIRGLRAKAKVE
ncbi:MAG TPA: peptidylprolyl isomerase [Burkholderiales bacterium]|nr:peptidylprolyl isomerase [Burkholderiales bacterium]